MTRNTPHNAFMLLEVVIAVGLLVLGMAVIGAQIQSSLLRAFETDQLARVVFLAESKIAEIDTGLIPPEQEIERDFGRLFPEYAWRLAMEPTEEPDLIFLRLEILHDPARIIDDEFDFESAEVLETYFTLRAVPRPLNLVVDFGMDEQIAEKMNEDLADVGDGTLNVHEFNPAAFRDLEIEEIIQVLPILMQAFGVQKSDLLHLVPEELRPQLEALFAEHADQLDPDADQDAEGTPDGAQAEESGQGNLDGSGMTTGDEESGGEESGDDEATNDDGKDDKPGRIQAPRSDRGRRDGRSGPPPKRRGGRDQ